MMDFYEAFLEQSHYVLTDLLKKSYTSIETLYEEHLRMLSLLASLALGLQLPCGIYKIPKERQLHNVANLLLIDLPGGQICWPIPDTKLPYFRDLPLYKGVWRGIPRLETQWQILLNPKLPFVNYPTDKIEVAPR